MSKQAAHGTRIWLNQWDLSGYLNSSEQAVDQETPVVTCFAEAGPRRVVGNYDVSHSDLGLFDGTDDVIDEILHALLENSSDHYLTKLFGSSAEGGVAYDSFVSLTKKPLSGAVGGAVLLNVESAGRNGIARGNVLANLTAVAAGNRAGVNQGIKASGITYRVIFRLFAFAGTSVTMTVEQSSDDAAGDPYAAVAGLTSGALSAAGVVVATTTAAMEAWRRVSLAGTFSSALIGVTAGEVEGTA